MRGHVTEREREREREREIHTCTHVRGRPPRAPLASGRVRLEFEACALEVRVWFDLLWFTFGFRDLPHKGREHRGNAGDAALCQTFSKVSVLVYLLYKVTIQGTFEKFCLSTAPLGPASRPRCHDPHEHAGMSR